MKIDTFGVEMWMNEWENNCEFNLAETCVESLTLTELLNITGRNETDLSALLPLKMTYGDIKGSDRLRNAIAALYHRQKNTNKIKPKPNFPHISLTLTHFTSVSRNRKLCFNYFSANVFLFFLLVNFA